MPATDAHTPAPTPAGMLDRVLALHNADAGDVQRLEPATGMLELIEWRGLTPEAAEAWRWIDPRTDTTVCARAFRTGEPLAIPDVLSDPPFLPHAETAAALGFRAVYSFPVQLHGGCIGVLSVMHTTPRPLDPHLRRRTLDLLHARGPHWLTPAI